MYSMFYYSFYFNQPLNNWNISNVETMEEMFCTAESFNQSLNNWNIEPKHKNRMYSIFLDASSFDEKNALWYDFSKFPKNII